MRKIVRNYRSLPTVLRSADFFEKWNEVALTGDTKLIDPNLYRDPYKDPDGAGSRVLDKLKTWYLGKCAYCERLYKLDVEHFRPKGRITNENNVVLSPSGYYWLCYEWSNLLPSCITCNREGGKADKFPILGHRVTTPSFRNGKLTKTRCLITQEHFRQEIPYLLNPEIDNPVDYFAFEIEGVRKGIKMKGIDPQSRGKMTIQICKLNRPEIKIQRQLVVEDFSKAITSLFSQYRIGSKNASQLKDGIDLLLQKLYDNARDESLEHTYLRNYMIAKEQHFADLVLPYLGTKMGTIVLAAYKSYLPT